MKLKFGAIVVDGRGKIGGHVASRNRGGAYLRTKVTPVNPSTSAQVRVRNRLTVISQFWKSLTEAQRGSFNAAVNDFSKTDIFGDIKSPSGFNLFQRLNNNLANVGITIIQNAPVPSAVATSLIGALSIDVGSGDAMTLALASSVPTGSSVEIWATPPLSPGINFVKSEYRLIKVSPAAATSPIDIQTEYLDVFGTPAAGTKVFARIKYVNTTTGQASQYQSTNTIVVST